MGKHAWQRAKSFREPIFPETLVLPPYTSPFDYSWPVSEHEVYILDTGITNAKLVRDFISCLFSFGATIVNYFSINTRLKTFKRN
jgi:hypothetical protein